MTDRAHSLARDELVRVLTVFSGVTTSDGAEDKDTLIDSSLIGENDFITGKTILLMSGDAKYEDKGALSFDPDTGTITLESGVSAQIVAGTLFRILNISSVETLIKDLTKGLISFSGTTTSDGGALGSSLICSDLEDEADFNGNQVVVTTGLYRGQARDIVAATTGGTVTPHLNFGGVIVEGTEFIITAIRVVPAEVAALAADLGDMADAATSDDMTDIETTSALAKLRLILERLSLDAFTATIQGAARTELDTMLAQLATYFAAGGAAFSSQVNNQTLRTNLEDILQDFFAVIGCDGTESFAPYIRGITFTTLEGAIGGLADYFAAGGEAFSKQVNNQTLRTSLEDILQDFFAVIGCDGTESFAPYIRGITFTTLEGAIGALADYFAAGGEAFSKQVNNQPLRTSLEDILQDFFAVIGCDGTESFAPYIRGAFKTTVEGAIGGLADYFAAGGEAFSKQVNNLTLRASLEDILQDFFAVVGCDGTNAFNPSVGGSERTTIEAAFAALSTMLDTIDGLLDDIAGATGVFHEQADVALSFDTVSGSETNVFNLIVASTRYIIRSLRLKFATPGANTITVRLYELVNDGLVVVDTFEVTSANFGTYHSLMDMFGMAQLAGDNLKVTTRVSAGGDIATLGQYSWGKTNV